MILTERELKRMAMNVLIHEELAQTAVVGPKAGQFLASPKGKELEKKGQAQASSILGKAQTSMRTVGDLKKVIMASMAKRRSKREKAGLWTTIGGAAGSLIYPLVQMAMPAAALAGPAGILGATAITSLAGGILGYMTNVIASRNHVSGTPLQDFSVDQRILNLLSDEQEREFIQYMAGVLERVPDNTPLEKFNMTNELNTFLKTKYGIEIRDLHADKEGKAPVKEGLRIMSRQVLIENRVRQIKKNSRSSTLLSESTSLVKKAKSALKKKNVQALLLIEFILAGGNVPSSLKNIDKAKFLAILKSYVRDGKFPELKKGSTARTSQGDIDSVKRLMPKLGSLVVKSYTKQLDRDGDAAVEAMLDDLKSAKEFIASKSTSGKLSGEDRTLDNMEAATRRAEELVNNLARQDKKWKGAKVIGIENDTITTSKGVVVMNKKQQNQVWGEA